MAELATRFRSLFSPLRDLRQEYNQLVEQRRSLLDQRISAETAPLPLGEVLERVDAYAASRRHALAALVTTCLNRRGRAAEPDAGAIFRELFESIDRLDPLDGAAVKTALFAPLLRPAIAAAAAEMDSWPATALSSKDRAVRIEDIDRQLASLEARIGAIDAQAREADVAF